MVRRSRLEVDVPGAAIVDHPLAGTHTGRTAIGVGYLLAVSTVVLLSRWPTAFVPLTGPELPPVVDRIVAFAIVLVTLSTLVGALLYPVWNGGPVLAVAIPLAPHLASAIGARSLVLDVDLTLALAAAGLGATIAALREHLRSDAVRELAFRSRTTDAAVVASVTTVLAAVAVLRVRPVVGPHAGAGLWTAAGLTAVAATGVIGIWTAQAMAGWRTTPRVR